jgi:hypothetical protein
MQQELRALDSATDLNAKFSKVAKSSGVSSHIPKSKTSTTKIDNAKLKDICSRIPVFSLTYSKDPASKPLCGVHTTH